MKNSKRKQHCNKVQFHTEVAANIALVKLVKNKAKKGDPIASRLKIYRCQYCPCWHIGTNKRQIMWHLVEKRDEELRQLREKTKSSQEK